MEARENHLVRAHVSAKTTTKEIWVGKEVIDHPHTCIVAELDDKSASWVSKVRDELDVSYRLMPKEVTICGSSGVGSIVPGQKVSDIVLEIVHAIDSTREEMADREKNGFKFEPKIHVFPGTQIHVLTPSSQTMFHILHKKLKDSNIKFNESPFEYSPHCTIYNGDYLEKLLPNEEAITKRREAVKNFFGRFEVLPWNSQIKSIAIYECELRTSSNIHIQKLVEIPFSF